MNEKFNISKIGKDLWDDWLFGHAIDEVRDSSAFARPANSSRGILLILTIMKIFNGVESLDLSRSLDL